jgi:hypothetical protein
VAYPPANQPDNIGNVEVDDVPVHSGRHDNVAGAVNDVVTELGLNPSGAAADVTARLSTLDSTVAAKETPAGAQAKVDTHVNDTTDAHDASAVSFAPVGTIAATDTQAAVAEVATEAASALAAKNAVPAGYASPVTAAIDDPVVVGVGTFECWVVDGTTCFGIKRAADAFPWFLVTANGYVCFGDGTTSPYAADQASGFLHPVGESFIVESLMGDLTFSAGDELNISAVNQIRVGISPTVPTGFFGSLGATQPAAALTHAQVVVALQTLGLVAAGGTPTDYAPLADPTLTGTPDAPTAAQGTNTTQIATTAFVQQDAIVKTVIDAKGDLIAGTAADTSAAVTVGANDSLLMADSGQAAGIKWGNAATVIAALGLDSLAAGVRTSLDTGTPGQVGVDVSLAVGIAGGDTLNGGLAQAETLTLGSTSHSTRGTINIRDQVLLISEDKAFDATTVRVLADTPSARTVTFSSATAAGNQLIHTRFAPTVVWAANSPANACFMIHAVPLLKNDTSVRTIGTAVMFVASPTLRADTAALTPSGITGYQFAPTLDVVNSGTQTVTAVTGLSTTCVVGAGSTLTQYTGVTVASATGAGTVTTQVGIEIAAMTAATTNIGIRNASSTVYTRVTKAITATTDTIPITGTKIRLNNTSGSSKTLASTPTIADAQGGGDQLLYITNTSANDVVLQDEGTLPASNLKLGAATRTLTTGDTIVLLYDATLANWYEIGFTVVV